MEIFYPKGRWQRRYCWSSGGWRHWQRTLNPRPGVLKTILHQSLPLFYRVEGTGLPVVLVHGFAEDSRVWDSQIAALTNNYQLVIPDLPGSGQSPTSPGTMTLEELA